MDFNKNGDGLLPVIIQDEQSRQVLMLGFMNEEAYQKTLDEGKVTFYSRTKKRLWTKGETSGNFLWVKKIQQDCDEDTLLIKVRPEGPVCHTGMDTCFGEENKSSSFFLNYLEEVIQNRIQHPDEKSYTSQLIGKGINKVAQKVGEEAVETVIEATNGTLDLLKEESADLLYHLLILLNVKGLKLSDSIEVLEKRHQKK